MLFNSFAFLVFFLIVYGLYLLLNHKWQNRMLLVASYVFYGWWDWRFLSLVFFSTALDYWCGLGIHGSEDIKKRRFFLFLSICGNLAILGFFKYFNFFMSNFQALLGYAGITIQPRYLHIILPLGISFYTFQTMSYTIDIYRRQMAATKRFLDFALFVAFFPQLVAGPIERATHLLPQVLFPRKLTLEKFGQGCFLIFWGLFQKMFIADNLARIVDPVFSAPAPYNGVMVWLAVYAFSFQVLCDFAGYSDIARGLGTCMGFDIMVNFAYPFFSVNPVQFWQRWNISLSTWFRDYVYFPLGGSRNGRVQTYINIGITMLLCGLWHGAAWTFVIWGLYQGMLLIVHRMARPGLKGIRVPRGTVTAKLWFVCKVVFFFHVVCFGILIFRAQSVAQLCHMLRGLAFGLTTAGTAAGPVLFEIISLTWLLVIVNIIQFSKKDPFFIARSNIVIKALFFAACLYGMITRGVPGGQAFIYYVF